MNLVELAKRYNTPEKAREYFEKLRWPDGIRCAHCGSNKVYTIKSKPTSKRPVRPGLYKCGCCKKQFTVTVGTVMERTHIPLDKWLLAFYLICSAKKSISASQVHRTLGIQYHAAWFLQHRIRHAIKDNDLGFLSGVVEVDETYVGGKKRGKRGRGSENKTPVVALVARDGRVRTKVVRRVTQNNLHKVIKENVSSDSTIMTDEWRGYRGIGKFFKGGHKTVNHGKKEYARGDKYTNNAESFFGLLKRGIIGSFHHVSRKHLHRYCDEFAFRWNHRNISDAERMNAALGKLEGKRLKYKE